MSWLIIFADKFFLAFKLRQWKKLQNDEVTCKLFVNPICIGIYINWANNKVFSLDSCINHVISQAKYNALVISTDNQSNLWYSSPQPTIRNQESSFVQPCQGNTFGDRKLRWHAKEKRASSHLKCVKCYFCSSLLFLSCCSRLLELNCQTDPAGQVHASHLQNDGEWIQWRFRLVNLT